MIYLISGLQFTTWTLGLFFFPSSVQFFFQSILVFITIGFYNCLCRDYDAFWNLNLIICGQSVLITVSFNNFNLIIYGQLVLITVSFDIFSPNDFWKLSEGSTIEFCWLSRSFIFDSSIVHRWHQPWHQPRLLSGASSADNWALTSPVLYSF